MSVRTCAAAPRSVLWWKPGDCPTFISCFTTLYIYSSTLCYYLIFSNVTSPTSLPLHLDSLRNRAQASQIKTSGRYGRYKIVECEFCLPTSVVVTAHSGREGREPEIEVRIGNVRRRRGNVARPILLSVGSKWRLCVIDTVVFALKMSKFVIYSVVGGFESYPGTSGVELRTRHQRTDRSMDVRISTILRRHCPPHK